MKLFQLIKIFFKEKSEKNREELWNIFIRRAEETLEKSKRRSIHIYRKNGQLNDGFERRWNRVVDSAIRDITKVKNRIDELRPEAHRLAPVEWKELRELTIKLWNSVKVSASTLNPFKLEKTLNSGMDEFRQASHELRRTLRSRQ